MLSFFIPAKAGIYSHISNSIMTQPENEGTNKFAKEVSEFIY